MPDAGADATLDTGLDADSDVAPWYLAFDAPYDPDSPPLVGEVPPPDGGTCSGLDDCYQFYCDHESGWCCVGRITPGECKCGLGPGCSGSAALCCTTDASTTPACVSNNQCVTFAL